MMSHYRPNFEIVQWCGVQTPSSAINLCYDPVMWTMSSCPSVLLTDLLMISHSLLSQQEPISIKSLHKIQGLCLVGQTDTFWQNWKDGDLPPDVGELGVAVNNQNCDWAPTLLYLRTKPSFQSKFNPNRHLIEQNTRINPHTVLLIALCVSADTETPLIQISLSPVQTPEISAGPPVTVLTKYPPLRPGDTQTQFCWQLVFSY